MNSCPSPVGFLKRESTNMAYLVLQMPRCRNVQTVQILAERTHSAGGPSVQALQRLEQSVVVLLVHLDHPGGTGANDTTVEISFLLLVFYFLQHH